MKKLLMTLVVAAALGFGAKLPAEAAPVTLPDGTVFDAEWYAQQYPDVVAALGTEPEMLYQHYILAGRQEGRLPYSPELAAYRGVDYVTTDLNGAAVSLKDIFATRRYTLVNLWATWCGPCKSELPELARLAAELRASGGELIGLLDDGDTPVGRTRAGELLAAAGADYRNLVLTPEMSRAFYTGYVPTTYLIDQSGSIVGEPIIGADVAAYRAAVEALLAR